MTMTADERQLQEYARGLGARMARLEAAQPGESARYDEIAELVTPLPVCVVERDDGALATLKARADRSEARGRMFVAFYERDHARFMAAGWRRKARNTLDDSCGQVDALRERVARLHVSRARLTTERDAAVDLVRRACREIARREPEAAAAILDDLERVGGGL